MDLNCIVSPTHQKSKPRALICYICGREFGTKSLKIHLKTCVQMWEYQEEKKPKKERRPIPQPPPDLEELLDNDNIEWDKAEIYNIQASEKYNNEGLVKCEFCNRTFFDHRMVGHRKICTKDRPVNPLPDKFATSIDFGNNRCKSTPKYRGSEDIERIMEKNKIYMPKNKELQANEINFLDFNKEKYIENTKSVLEASEHEENDDILHITNSFVVNSVKENIGKKENIPLDKKNTESFIKKIRFDKKNVNITNETSPKSQKPKNLNSSPKQQIDSKKNENLDKIDQITTSKQKLKSIIGQISEGISNQNKNDSFDKKNKNEGNISNLIENRPKNKTVITKTTESFAKKKVGDRKKSALYMTSVHSDSFGSKKKESDENLENVKKKENIDNDGIMENARKSYKIYIPAKMMDFNY